MVWHYLRLPPWLLPATPLVGCVLVLWLVAWLTYCRLHDWSTTWLATALFAALPWFFVSSGWLLHFDSWLVLGLLTVAFVPSTWALAAACLATPWIDERFLLALPVCVVVRGASYDWVHQPNRGKILSELTIVAAASLPYTALRTGVWLHGDRIATAYVQLWSNAPSVPWTRFLEGLWSGFRAGWVVILAAVVFGARRAGWPWAAAFIVAILGTAVGGLFIAMDMSRTLMMLSPVLLLGVWLWESWRPAALWFVLPVVVAANFVLPAAHVMWHDKVNISSLPAEIHEWRNPPDFLAAARLINEAEQSFAAGHAVEGSAKLDQAILLSPVYSSAFVKRAALRMQAGDYATAEPDLEKALELDAENPTGLFLRGVIRGSRQQTALAAEDFRKALAIAPADWPARQDAEQFLQAATSAIEPATTPPVP